MKIARSILKAWLPIAAAVVLLCGVLYSTLQQDIRLGANDPQIQMAEEPAAALAGGASPDSLLPPGVTDVAGSLASYLIIYDALGNVTASSAVLHGQTPAVPSGVFDYTRQHGEDRISSQPEPGVRSAVVVVAVQGGQGGFALAGRSLREAEASIAWLGSQALLGTAGTLAATFVLTSVLAVLLRTREPTPA